MAVKLTPTRVRNLKYDKNGSRIQRLWDSQVIGLGIQVFPNGRRSWVIRYAPPNSKQRQRIVKIGQYPELTLAAARDMGIDWKRSITERVDPKEVKVMEDELTVEVIYKQYSKSTYFENTLSDSRQANFKSAIRTHLLPSVGAYPIKAVTMEQLEGIAEDLIRQGREGACRGYLNCGKRLFNWAYKKGWLDNNPFLRIETADLGFTTTGKREVEVTDALIRSIWDIPTPYPTIRALVRWCLVTGYRRDESRLLTWAMIRDKVVTLPSTKNKRAHSLPILGLMKDILKEAKTYNSPYVFSMESAPLSRGLITKEIQAAKGDWTLHTTRHVVGTRLADLGFQKESRDLVLNHKNQSVDGIYNNSQQMALKRRALIGWHRELKKIVNPSKG